VFTRAERILDLSADARKLKAIVTTIFGHLVCHLEKNGQRTNPHTRTQEIKNQALKEIPFSGAISFAFYGLKTRPYGICTKF